MNVVVYSKNRPSSEYLSQQEMEELLDSPDSLPSFLSVSYADSSPKARQRCALYALAELMQPTKEGSSFHELLKTL